MPVELRISVRVPQRFAAMARTQVRRMRDAMHKEEFGYSSDFDGTWVATEELLREFPKLMEDKAGVYRPVVALTMLPESVGPVPVAIMTGNTDDYIQFQALDGLREFYRSVGYLHAMQLVDTYAQNGTWKRQHDPNGNSIPGIGRAYAEEKGFFFPREHILAIRDEYLEALSTVLPGHNFFKEKPLIKRPLGSGTESSHFGVEFQNRLGVQLAWVAVPQKDEVDVRLEIISVAQKEVNGLVTRTGEPYRQNPGGTYSIDVDHSNADKTVGSFDFDQTRGLTFDLFTGDAVYKKIRDGREYEGNDFSMRKNPNAAVLAVNKDQKEVKDLVEREKIENVIPAGIDSGDGLLVGPEATRAWAAFAFANKVQVALEREKLSDRDKSDIMSVINRSGLGETGEIEVHYHVH